MQTYVYSSVRHTGRNRFSRGRKRAPAEPTLPYPAFIAYADIPAARQAMSRLNDLLRGAGARWHLQPMLWRFDQLDNPRWRQMALRDSARAATIVLALGKTSVLTADAEAWLSALVIQQRGATITALAFLGDDGAWTISLRQAEAGLDNHASSTQLPVSRGHALTGVPDHERSVAACAA